MKLTRVAALFALTALVSLAAAQEIHNWRSSVTGWVWKDASGQCWRDGSWTPATAAPECDGAIVAKPVAVAPAAPAAPAPVPAPAPAVAPATAAEPAPAPMVAVALQAVPEAVAAADAERVVVVDKSAPAAMAAAPEAAPAPAPAAAVAPAPAPAPAAAIAPAALAAPAPAAVPAKMTFATDTFFDFDKSVLKAEGKARLKELGEKIKSISLEVVIVVGHTDNVGTDAYNQKLSERRAEAVKAFLISLGIPKSRIYTEGKGESAPAADNKTPAGRAKNRRVEVEVVGTK